MMGLFYRMTVNYAGLV